MHRAQVFRHQVRVPARHSQCGMPEHLLQMEDGPTTAEVVHGEGVPEGVEGAGRWGEAEPPA